jgi:lipopolysaccharide transport system ATP-binding protein
MICGILRPTLGSVGVRGRIAPMLALGAGFKPVLSGRQNVFLNLSLLGIAERDIRSRYDSILDFAELHEAIDAPLGTYSSGMQARLGFACAVHTDPSILVVDEVLSVGDARFRVKCRNKINDLRRTGTSLLLVSHSPILVETLSDECLYLRDGRTAMLGPPREVLRAYEEDGVGREAAANAATAGHLATPSEAGIAIRELNFDGHGAESTPWTTGRDAGLRILLAVARPTDEVSLNVMLFDAAQAGGDAVWFFSSSRDIGWLRFPAGQATIRLQLPHLGLRAGTYRLKLSLSRGKMHDILGVVDNLRVVVRAGEGLSGGVYYQPRNWKLTGAEAPFDPAQETAELGPEDLDV